jgi:hypothetical protein
MFSLVSIVTRARRSRESDGLVDGARAQSLDNDPLNVAGGTESPSHEQGGVVTD